VLFLKKSRSESLGLKMRRTEKTPEFPRKNFLFKSHLESREEDGRITSRLFVRIKYENDNFTSLFQ
jgi:hypothetical protein